MKPTKLTEAYDAVTFATKYIGSAHEFRYNLGKALNSLTVLKDAPLEDKERVNATLQQLHQIFNLALEIEHEIDNKAKDEPTYP